MSIVKIGIDASYNHTGLVFRFDDGTCKMYLISSAEEKHTVSAVFVKYDRPWEQEGDSFSVKDMKKIESAENLFKTILDIIKKNKNERGFTELDIRIEGNVYNTFQKGALLRMPDMVCLNSVLKAYLRRINGAKVSVYPPTAIKKAFTGKGSGKKSNMLDKFQSLYPNFDYTGKVDDIIDAYALACMP